MLMPKPTPKGRLERWFDRLAICYDRRMDNAQRKRRIKYGEPDTDMEDMLSGIIFDINKMLGFEEDPKNLKRFIK